MIGKMDPKQAHNTDLRKSIEIGLDEGLTALEEGIFDLNDEQMQTFPIPGHTCIAWIAMHSLLNLDRYANEFQTGQQAFEHEYRWDLRDSKPEDEPKPGDDFPSQKDIMATLVAVRNAIMPAIASATPTDLDGKRMAPDRWARTSADAYMRTIWHTAGHVREIWLMRGALQLIDGKSWPMQHWA
jgi:hypothetical protein